MPTVTGYGFGSGIELNVQDFEGGPVSKLKENTDLFVNALKKREEIGEVYCSYEVNFPQYTVSVNAAICKHYGIEASEVLRTLNGYVSSNYASQYNAFGRLYHVMLQAEPEQRSEKDDLNNIFVTSEDGNFIPITELVTLKKSYGVQSLNRFNLFSSISVEVEPDDDYSTGDAIKAIDEVAEKVLPQGYGFEYSGTTREEVSQTGNAIWIFLLVIVFIYLVLCSLYESLFVPLAVLLSVPFGLVDCCLFVILFELENNIYMQVGIIMIIGLLSKTAILLTEYASERRRQGLGIREAALEAAKVRLRPITMTALTLIIGLLPQAFASGAGAVGNISLGLCVIGGMIVGTLSLLFFVPIFFIIFQLLEERYIPTRKNMVAAALVVLIGLSGMITSCKTFSNYDSQQINIDSIVRSDLSVATTNELVATKGWREIFTDPHLVALIEEGLAENSDLNIAKLNIEVAKAMLRNAKGELFPSLDLGVEGSTSRFGLRNRHRDNGGDEDDEDEKGSVLTESAYTFGATLSWEVDIFGKKQNAKKAAAAGVEEKYAQLQTVIVELISTIATSYYQLAMYDAQITEAHTTIENWQEYIRTQKALMTVGEATSDDVAQAEASCLEAEATLEQLTLQMQQAENALCSVLGRQSGHIERSDFKTILQSFKEISSINIRALTSRPDIRQAEAELKQAFYATNEARAAFYPSLNLTGSAGWTNDAGEIINPGSLLLRAIGSLTQPIFNNGRLKAELKQAEAEQEEAKINFRQRVLEAG
jgi:NodT family efflux transporter outer membrane factor (OMF) lipoprotein